MTVNYKAHIILQVWKYFKLSQKVNETVCYLSMTTSSTQEYSHAHCSATTISKQATDQGAWQW